MSPKLNKEIQLRLKAPLIALEKISNGRYLPKVFAKAALSELRIIEGLIQQEKVKECKIAARKN